MASIKESLKLNTWEGGFFGAMSGLTQNYLVPFALLLGAGNFMVSLVATLPGLLGSIVQLQAPAVLNIVRSARRYMVIFLTGNAISWFLLALLPFLADEAIVLNGFFILILIGTIFTFMLNPIWLSYMGELVPIRDRARYFGDRNAVASLATLVSILFAGGILSLFADVYGFALLFFLAAIMRILSMRCIAKSKDLPVAFPKGKLNLKKFIKDAPQNDFGRFVSLAVFLRVAAYISAPFFFVYQLNVLEFNYFLFTILQMAVVISSILSVRYWAKLADMKGNRLVLMYSSFIIAIIPFLWITTKAFPALFLFELLSGFGWSGFLLASSNYMLEASEQRTRTRFISYFNLFNQLAIVIGGLLGSALLALFGLFTVDAALPFLILFGVSGISRLAVAIIAKPKLRELRFVAVPIKQTGVRTYINVLPQRGPLFISLPSPKEVFKEKMRVNLDRGREFDDFMKQGRPKRVDRRMSTKEKDLMRERFIEKAAGRKIPKKPRGFKK
ncbi:MFS transporter [Candidatus Woesearchaeota archaeon]|nr:MFS transporter [Candidatus Woesearchaeota archaeon]